METPPTIATQPVEPRPQQPPTSPVAKAPTQTSPRAVQSFDDRQKYVYEKPVSSVKPHPNTQTETGSSSSKGSTWKIAWIVFGLIALMILGVIMVGGRTAPPATITRIVEVVKTVEVLKEGAPVIVTATPEPSQVNQTQTVTNGTVLPIPERISIVNIDQIELLHTINAHNNRVTTLSFSPDGKLLASGSDDSSIRIWDFQTETLLQTLQGHSSYIWGLGFSPNGQYLASASQDGHVLLWQKSNADFELRNDIQGHSEGMWSIAWSGDSSKFASAGGDQVWLFNVFDGRFIEKFDGNQAWETGMAFSPDNSQFASHTPNDSIIIWDIEKRTIVQSLSSPGFGDLLYSQDGKLLIFATGNSIEIWDSEKWSKKRTLEIDAERLSINPDGSLLASNAGDHINPLLCLWDVSSGKLLSQIPIQEVDAIRSIKFSPDGDFIAVASHDGKIRIFGLPK